MYDSVDSLLLLLLRTVRQALSRRIPRWPSSDAFETVEEGEDSLLIAEGSSPEAQEEVEGAAVALLTESSMEIDQSLEACEPIVEVLAADRSLPAVVDTYSLHLRVYASALMYYRSRGSPKWNLRQSLNSRVILTDIFSNRQTQMLAEFVVVLVHIFPSSHFSIDIQLQLFVMFLNQI